MSIRSFYKKSRQSSQTQVTYFALGLATAGLAILMANYAIGISPTN